MRLTQDVERLTEELASAQDRIAMLEAQLAAPVITPAQYTAMQETIARLEQAHHKSVEALTHIAEYWNGHENERAMADACHHVVEIARQALGEGKEGA